MSAWVWILVVVIILSVVGIGFKSFVGSIFAGVDKIVNTVTSGKFVESETGKQLANNITKWLEPKI
jgi:hypothetical protein